MAVNNEDYSALDELQAEEQIELLDANDSLHELGLRTEFELPQLVVGGDQSSGKSSVLEAISGIRFPTGDSFCTCFATELRLRRTPEGTKTSMRVWIEPAPYRSAMDFSVPEHITGPEHLKEAIEAAQGHLKLIEPSRELFDDKFIAVIKGPEVPSLTIVDLPGVFHVKEEGKDPETAKQLVMSYMEAPTSIILLVVAADNEYVNQVILELAKEADPEGHRTLGIITKPDKVDSGSPKEQFCLRMIRNEERYFDLGWHVLLNRGFKEMNMSFQDRNKREETWFQQRQPWSKLPADKLGAGSLRIKLSRILFNEITKGLPILMSKIKQHIDRCEEEAAKFGTKRLDEPAQREYLYDVHRRLKEIIDRGVEGRYVGEFFGSVFSADGKAARLRNVLRNHATGFCHRMHKAGATFHVISKHDRNDEIESVKSGAAIPELYDGHRCEKVESDVHLQAGGNCCVTETAFLEAVRVYMAHNKGRELPGEPPDWMVDAVFKIQCAPWKDIAREYLESCGQAVQSFIRLAVAHAAPPHTANAILLYFVNDKLHEAKRLVDEKLKELLEPYLIDAHMTEDPQYQKLRDDRWRKVDPELRAYETAHGLDQARQVFIKMQSYYDIVLYRFVDNVISLAMESCLVRPLRDAFDFHRVLNIDGKTLQKIAGEPDQVGRDRERNATKLRILQNVLDIYGKHSSVNTLNEYEGHQSIPSGNLGPPTARLIPTRANPRSHASRHTDDDVKRPSAQSMSSETSTMSSPDTPASTPEADPRAQLLRQKDNGHSTLASGSSAEVDNVQSTPFPREALISPSPRRRKQNRPGPDQGTDFDEHQASGSPRPRVRPPTPAPPKLGYGANVPLWNNPSIPGSFGGTG